jgi:hypothetical protein
MDTVLMDSVLMDTPVLGASGRWPPRRPDVPLKPGCAGQRSAGAGAALNTGDAS